MYGTQGNISGRQTAPILSHRPPFCLNGHYFVSTAAIFSQRPPFCLNGRHFASVAAILPQWLPFCLNSRHFVDGFNTCYPCNSGCSQPASVRSRADSVMESSTDADSSLFAPSPPSSMIDSPMPLPLAEPDENDGVIGSGMVTGAGTWWVVGGGKGRALTGGGAASLQRPIVPVAPFVSYSQFSLFSIMVCSTL